MVQALDDAPEVLKTMGLLTGATFCLGGESGRREDGFGQARAAPAATAAGQDRNEVTMLAVGGSHIGRPSESTAQAVIEAAIEQGIRTFDTAQL